MPAGDLSVGSDPSGMKQYRYSEAWLPLCDRVRGFRQQLCVSLPELQKPWTNCLPLAFWEGFWGISFKLEIFENKHLAPGVVLCNGLEGGPKVWSWTRDFLVLKKSEMETVLSDHPSLPSQACLLGSAGAAVLYGCSSLQCSKGCPSLVVGCLLDQMQSWCSVWFQVAILGFIPGVWCGWKLLTASVSCARQLCTVPYFSSAGHVQLLWSGGSGEDVRRFGNAALLW